MENSLISKALELSKKLNLRMVAIPSVLPKSVFLFKEIGEISICVTLSSETGLLLVETIGGFSQKNAWDLRYVICENISLENPDVVDQIASGIDEVKRKLKTFAKTDFDGIFAEVTPKLLSKEVSWPYSEKILHLLYYRTLGYIQPSFLRISYFDNITRELCWEISGDTLLCAIVWPPNLSAVVIQKEETYGQFRSFFIPGEKRIGVATIPENSMQLLEEVSPRIATYFVEAAKALSECWSLELCGLKLL